jgi:hypothetical protein
VGGSDPPEAVQLRETLDAVTAVAWRPVGGGRANVVALMVVLGAELIPLRL